VPQVSDAGLLYVWPFQHTGEKIELVQMWSYSAPFAIAIVPQLAPRG
jgi:hypothetical protein